MQDEATVDGVKHMFFKCKNCSCRTYTHEVAHIAGSLTAGLCLARPIAIG